MELQNSIKTTQNLPESSTGIETYASLVNELKHNLQRVLVHIQGPRTFCLKQLPNETCWGAPVVLSNLDDLAHAIPFSKAETLFGTDCDILIYDGFSGISIDVLCMAAGLIRAGGVLILMTPDNMHTVDDPYGIWQNRKPEVSRFIDYLLEQIMHMVVIRSGQNKMLLPDVIPMATMTEFTDQKSSEQKELILELNNWFVNEQPLFLLTADRGRGKSTALGMFAQQLEASSEIIVTAASRNQVAILLKQIGDQANVSFIAPDEIIRENKKLSCLIIDEAAMIPLNMLKQLEGLASKTILATTTGGYEGTGQGFLLKFMAQIDQQSCMHKQLHHPVRWGEGDLLERWLNRVLFFQPILVNKEIDLNNVEISLLTKKQLDSNRLLLRAIYQLLISAHYRTRPSDLRQLMDDENQQIIIAHQQQAVLGVLLLNEEGGFDDSLAHEIYMGTRRPQGHLLSQMLTAQAGVKGFARFRGYRVQRIAVNDQYRRRGVGRLMMERARQLVIEHHLDFLGSSFALDHTMAPFWNKMGFQLMHIASGKGKSSGRQTIAVLYSETSEVKEIIKSQQQRISESLPVWLLSYCNDMYWKDVLTLIQLLDKQNVLTEQENDEIMAFAYGFRGLELSLNSLQKLLLTSLQDAQIVKSLTNLEIALLIEKILLNRDWQKLTGYQVVYGKKHYLKLLRINIKKLYEHTRPSQ